MARLTISISEDRSEKIEELAETDEYESKSEVVNSFIDTAESTEQVEQENQRLRREKRTLIEQQEEHDELVNWADQQKTWIERKTERENSPLHQRLRWFVFGRD